MTADDMALVQEYSRSNSEAAFATLVSRHVSLVYSVGLRQTGDPSLAEDITQAVFIILSRKAGSLGPETILPGWLCRTARYVAANALTMQRRRQRREQEASMQSFPDDPGSDTWTQIAPLLDTALEQLGEKEHNAVVLRFFEGKNFKEVGAALGASEDAAKMRVSRALEKLRRFFVKRGVVSTTALIAGAISANSIQAAPATLATSVTAVTALKGATAAVSTSTLIKGALKLMAWTKMKTVAVATVAALAILGTTTVAVKQLTRPSIEEFFARADSKFLNEAPAVLIFRPTHYPTSNLSIGGDPAAPGRLMGRGRSAPWLLCDAYGFIPQRMVLPPNLPPGKFDFLITTPGDPRAALQTKIKEHLGLTAHTETKETDVLLLKARDAVGPGLKLSQGGESKIFDYEGKMTVTNFKMSDPSGSVPDCFGFLLGIPVIDETGLTGAYDFELHWDGKFDLPESLDQRREIERAIHDQLGLDLVPARRPIEMLVVEKSN